MYVCIYIYIYIYIYIHTYTYIYIYICIADCGQMGIFISYILFSLFSYVYAFWVVSIFRGLCALTVFRNWPRS